MDAFEVLRQMHMEARETFDKIDQAAHDERGGLWAKLRADLTAHEGMEESWVYGPAASEAGSRDEMLAGWEPLHRNMVAEANRLMDEMGRMEPRDPQWLTTVRQLRTTLEQHMAQEEGEIWPRIRQVWGQEKLDAAGGQLQAAKTVAGVGSAVAGALGAVGEALKGNR